MKGEMHVDHPAHYNTGRIEVIDFLEDQNLGFSLGNAVKYICRAEHKQNAVQDLKKAMWYLEREIARRDGTLVTKTQRNFGPKPSIKIQCELGASKPDLPEF